MKNKFTRALSFLLCLILFASSFTVFVSADGEEQQQEKTTLLLNRDFDEGWDFNGFTNAQKQHKFYVDREVDITSGGYNHFMRFEFTENTDDGYIAVNGSSFTEHTVLGFRFMIDDKITYSDRIGYSQVSTNTKQNSFLGTSVSGDVVSLTAFGAKLATLEYGKWVRLVYDFDWTAQNDSTRGDCTVYAYDENDELIAQYTKQGVYTLNVLRFGKHKSGNYYGQSVCIDDIYLYNSTTGAQLTEEELDAIGYGSKVNSSAAKTVDVGTGTVDVSHLEKSIAMKVGVDYCLLNQEERLPILEDATKGDVYGAPTTVNGKIFVPLQILLEQLGYSVYEHSNGQAYDISSGKNTTSIFAGRNSVLVNGEIVYLSEAPSFLSVTVGKNEYSYLAVCLDDVNTLFPDQYVTYDTMGFFVICGQKDVLDRSKAADMRTMLTMMKKFIFTIPTAATLREDMAEYTERVNGEAFAHPYLQANSQTFAELRAQYYATKGDEIYDATLNKNLKSLVNSGLSHVKRWAKKIVKGQVGAEAWDSAYNRYEEEGYGIFVDGTNDANDTIYLPELQYLPGISHEIDHADGLHAIIYENTIQVIWTDYLPSGEKVIKRGGVHEKDEEGNLLYDENGAPVMRSGTGTKTLSYSNYNNGYDSDGGRFSDSDTMHNVFSALGYAYQVTGNINYAKLAWQYARALGDWYHWGPTHFLNAADSAQQYAIGYDFCQPAWKELYEQTGEYNPNTIRDILFVKGVYTGYSCGILGTLPSTEKFLELTGGVDTEMWPLTHQEGNPNHGFRFINMTNNWGCVCNCGMILSALAVIDDPNPQHAAITDALLEACMDGLKSSGLDCYAPDGSYAESPGYWAYGTNQFFITVLALVTATGKDYGYMDTWGIDKTCYFALHIMSSDNKSFDYHDSSMGNIDSSMFSFAGTMLADPDLVAIRQQMLAKGKVGVTRFDTYHYDPALTTREVTMPKSYYMEGIETYTIRSGWDSDALFVGLHGGKQLVNHGNLDGGDWIYHRNRTRFIIEMGSENYNVGNYFSSSVRYTFYRTNPEGQNVVFITSSQGTHPYGVTTDGESKIIDTYLNEYGSYGILDMASVYPKVLAAKRGILATNNYDTVVIQDEISFASMSSLYWQAHVAKGADIKLSDDGRTVYITLNGQVLRLSIASKISRYKFQILDCDSDDDIILDVTKRKSGDNSNNKQYSRAKYQKIVIELQDAILFSCAVAVELVDVVGDSKPVGYEYVEMSEWEPVAAPAGDNFVSTSPVDINPAKASLTASVTAMLGQNTFIRTIGISDALNSRVAEFYNALITVEYSKRQYPSVGSVAAQKNEYDGYYGLYKKLHEYIDGSAATINQIARKLVGVTIE